MLVLGRKVEEVVVIGGEIVVAVLGIKGNQVRLGIQAPRQVPVWREELGPPDGHAAGPQTAESERA